MKLLGFLHAKRYESRGGKVERKGGLKGEGVVVGVNISKSFMYIYKDALMKHYYVKLIYAVKTHF